MMQLGLLESVVYLVGNLFSIYMIRCFFHIFFDTEASKLRKCLRVIAYVFYYCFNSAGFLYFHWPPALILLTNLVGCMMVSRTYIGKWKHRICAAIAIVSMSVLCENTIYYLLTFSGIRYTVTIGTTATNLLLFMIILLLQKTVDLKRGVEITFLEWASILFVPICSLFVSIIALDNCNDEAAAAFGGICMIFLNVLLFFLFDRIQSMYRKQLALTLFMEQSRAYENQMQMLQLSEEWISALRHDMKNHFIALNQLAEENDCPSVQQYLHSLTSFAEPQKTFAATGNTVIDSLLNLKLSEAAEYGAEIKTEFRILKEIPIEAKDICILLGNLLDNSLRALKNCRQEKKVLAVVMRQEPGKLFIRVENTYTEKIRRTGNVFKTTKRQKAGHGIGLKNVQRAVDSYNGQMDIETGDHLFSVKLLLYLEDEQ